ncbi:Uu.00g020970.m01.CDS01 [Anthostomella pinea]|uniref:Uu.00g020970.m01.CDS01 n=1 Tax=Anthostomella pinea TaxID=933095 RepID=A0AAI8W0T2_9PEZI|nr:Uu.00g020970.m01.CDS01 [Anthostomella pinea]
MRKVLNMAGASDRLPRPPYDPEIESIINSLGGMPERYEVEKLRKDAAVRIQPFTNALLADKSVCVEDVTIPGPRQGLTVSVVRPIGVRCGSQPCIVYIHGGALVAANRFAGLDTSVTWAREFNAISISVEYGRAPENSGQQPAEDCYAALTWVGSNLTQLGIDPERLILYGTSAGGGLAAATALMARDKGGPKLCGLFLECPMLDDRNQAVSTQQFSTGPFFNSTLNKFAWACLLGERVGTSSVTEYEAPARSLDLAGLPPTFIDCASADPFRDEIVAFASKLWEDGVAAELHVWPGGPHGYDRIVPSAPISVQARQARLAWIRRAFTKSI